MVVVCVNNGKKKTIQLKQLRQLERKPLLYNKATWLDLELTDACNSVIVMGDLFVLS